MSEGVSIVIPTRNSAAHIGTLLRSIQSQLVPPVETLMLDGSSTDETASIGRRLGATVVSYACNGDMRGYARNFGARIAKGSHLLFLDSDMELTKDVIAELTAMATRRIRAAIIPEQTLGTGLLGRVRTWEREVIQRSDLLAVARFLDKHLFFNVGGFDERILGFEDLDLQASLIEAGVVPVRTKEPILHHEEGIHPGSYLKKRRYYITTSHAYRAKHPVLASTVFSPVSRMRLYLNGVKSTSDIVPLLGAITLRGLELA